jgi:hypothetical protein
MPSYISREIIFPGFGQNLLFETTHVVIWHVTFAYYIYIVLRTSSFSFRHAVWAFSCARTNPYPVASVREADYGLTDRCHTDIHLWSSGSVSIVRLHYCLIFKKKFYIALCGLCEFVTIIIRIIFNIRVSLLWRVYPFSYLYNLVCSEWLEREKPRGWPRTPPCTYYN